jgi:heme/copper-type cytochrome/quinol oxidase subunit 4
MCFSATGSFALSGVLTGIGAASLARNSSKPHRMFAGIPLIFAVQQAAEGVVWLTIVDGERTAWHRLAVSIFLAIAFVVWPMWLPFTLRRIEKNPTRLRALSVLCWAGGLLAAYASFVLLRFRPVAQIVGHSLRYDYATSGDLSRHLLYLVAYVIPTLVPFFVSTASLARTIGITLLVSLVASAVVQRDALASVWCFFAALLSCLILVAVGREQPSQSLARTLPNT